MLKSAREAGVNTRWVFGDPGYEAALAAFVGRALAPGPGNAFLASFRAFEAGVAEDGAANGLIQTVLKLTLPGVPDIYQGAELWDQSLVDPDNRRPVDFAARAEMLRRDAPIRLPSQDGAAKLALIAALLRLRSTRPALFAEGSYQPLLASGPAAAHLCAFARQHEADVLIVAVALHPATPARRSWSGTRLAAPPNVPGPLVNILDGREVVDLDPSSLFGASPIAVMCRG